MTPETERTCLILSNQLLKNTTETYSRRIEVLTANLHKAEADLKSAIALNGAYNNKVVLLEQGIAKMPTNLMMADLQAKLDSNERLFNSHIGYYKTELASMQSRLNVAQADLKLTTDLNHQYQFAHANDLMPRIIITGEAAGKLLDLQSKLDMAQARNKDNERLLAATQDSQGNAIRQLDDQQHLLANAKYEFRTKLNEQRHHADYIEDQLKITKEGLALAQQEIHKKSLDIARLTTSMDKIHGLVEYEGKTS